MQLDFTNLIHMDFKISFCNKYCKLAGSHRGEAYGKYIRYASSSSSLSSSSSSSCSLRVSCIPCSLILKVELVPLSLLRSSNVPSSFWSVFTWCIVPYFIILCSWSEDGRKRPKHVAAVSKWRLVTFDGILNDLFERKEIIFQKFTEEVPYHPVPFVYYWGRTTDVQKEEIQKGSRKCGIRQCMRYTISGGSEIYWRWNSLKAWGEQKLATQACFPSLHILCLLHIPLLCSQ